MSDSEGSTDTVYVTHYTIDDQPVLEEKVEQESSVEQDESSVKQDKYSVKQDEYSVKQDEYSAEQDEYSDEQDECSVKQDKYSVFKEVVEEMEKEGGIEQEIHFDAQTIAVEQWPYDDFYLPLKVKKDSLVSEPVVSKSLNPPRVKCTVKSEKSTFEGTLEVAYVHFLNLPEKPGASCSFKVKVGKTTFDSAWPRYEKESDEEESDLASRPFRH